MPHPPSPARYDRRDLFLFGMLAVGFTALGAALLFWLPRPAIKYDAVEYQLLAESLARGEGFRFHPQDLPTAYRPPLYPVLLALAFLGFGTHVDVAYGVQAIFHGLTVGVTYLLGREFLARRYATGAAILTGLSVGLTCLVGFLMTETLQTLLVVTGALVLVRWMRAWSWRWAAVVGLVWGLAVLAKGTNAAILALWLAALLVVRWRDWRRVVPGMALACVTVALVMAPWTARNALHFGRLALVSTNIGIQWYVATLDPITFDRSDPRMMQVVNEANARKLNEAETDRLFLQHGLTRFFNDPLFHIKRAARNAVRLWELPPRDSLEYLKPTVMYNDLPEYRAVVWFHYLTLGLAVAGVARALWRREAAVLWLWLVPVAVSLVYSLFWVIYRFTAPGLPVLYLSVAYALAGLPALGRVRTRVVALHPPAPSSPPWEEGVDARGPFLLLPDLGGGSPFGCAQGKLHAATAGAGHHPGGDMPDRGGRWLRLGDAALVLCGVAAAAVLWGTHRTSFTVASPHPYPNGADLAWVVVNPDDSAAFTSAHVARLDLAADGDRLYLLDQQWQIRAELRPGDLPHGGWTPPVPGQFVIFKLVTDQQGQGWGFQADGVSTVRPGRD